MGKPCMQLFSEFNDPIEKFGPPPTNVPKSSTSSGRSSLTLNLNLRWPQKKPEDTVKLTVKFLGQPATKDPAKTIERIKTAAEEWTHHANIQFIWVEKATDEAIIRVAFKENGGYNSLVGTDHLKPRYINNPTQHTMNLDFGWYKDNQYLPDDEKEIRQITLHEFGHALGCVHEHVSSNTAGEIQWNKDAVYTWFADAKNQNPPWSKKKVDHNYNSFEPMAKDAVLATSKWDRKSIMQYEILKGWAKNLPDGVPATEVLSKYDISFIKETYGPPLSKK